MSSLSLFSHVNHPSRIHHDSVQTISVIHKFHFYFIYPLLSFICPFICDLRNTRYMLSNAMIIVTVVYILPFIIPVFFIIILISIVVWMIRR